MKIVITFKSLIFLLLLTGCQNKEARKEYDAFYKANIEEDERCSEFEESLRKYLDESASDFKFVKDENKALEAIRNFKMELTSQKRSLKFDELTNKECSNEASSERLLMCFGQLDAMSFFKALLDAAKTYGWSKETNRKAAELASSYVRFHFKEPHNLLSVSILADVIKQLSVNGFMKNDVSVPLASIEKELDTLREKRRQSMKDRLKEGCEGALKAAEEEKILGDQYLEKLKQFEKDLP